MKPILFIRDSASLAALWQAAANKKLSQFETRTKVDPADLDRVEVALVWKPWVGFLASLPNLKLTVSVGAGVDHIVGHDTAYPRHVPLVRMVDPGLSQGMCDYVAWACLSVLRQARHHLRQQGQHAWVTAPLATSDTKTAAVLGLGQIGLPVAHTLRALGFQVLGWSRSPKSVEGIECLSGSSGFTQALSRADMVVNLLPSTADTYEVMNAAAFAVMRPGAAFINAGRGATVQEDDLLAALNSDQLSAAYLDVFQTEPLPEASPFWAHPKVMITPHNAAITHPDSGIRAVTRALDELAAGQPLSNLVDWDRGY